MPFLLPLPIIFSGKSNNPHKHNVNKISRKEGRPEYSRNIQFFLNIEKASASASRGSITVEAAFCIPLFLYAAVSLIWLLEIQALRTAVTQLHGPRPCAYHTYRGRHRARRHQRQRASTFGQPGRSG